MTGRIKMKQWYKKLIVILAVTSFAGLSVSCYGSFALTKKIYKWNGSLGNKFVNSLVFFILLALPVYELTTFADYVFLNVIEFWTGNNPVALGETKVITKDGVTMELSSPKPGVLVIKTPTLFMEAHESGATIRDNQGKLIAEVTPTEDGGALLNANQTTTKISAADLSTLGDLAEQTMNGAPTQRQLVETARQISH
jgi:hypothetical protein